MSVEYDGFMSFLKESDLAGKDRSHHYLVWKRYYSFKSSPDVKKMITLLEGRGYNIIFLTV